MLQDVSTVPFPMTDDGFVPAGRYTSREFHECERERLWPRAWQVACREEEIPRVGDFVEYVINHDSVLVVRTDGGRVKAFHNACRHRGTQLGRDCGSFPTGRIVCPFHGWQWDLEGTNSYVYARAGFPPECLTHAEIDLRPVQVGTRWGMVWVNLDLDAPSLDDHLNAMLPHVDPLRLDLMHVRWWKQVRLAANWKVAQEAFFEGYHAMQSHPELSLFVEGDGVNMEAMEAASRFVPYPEHGHWAQVHAAHAGDAAFHEGHSRVDTMIGNNRVQWQGCQAITAQRVYEIQEDLLASGVPADGDFPKLLMQKVNEDAQARNVPIPTFTPETSHWNHVFPNLTWLYGSGSCLMYRSRPADDDPNACVYDFWSLELVPEGTERSRPVQATDEFFRTMFVVQQDIGNIERQQRGLRSRGFAHTRLATEYEASINTFHRRLDQVLAEPLAD